MTGGWSLHIDRRAIDGVTAMSPNRPRRMAVTSGGHAFLDARPVDFSSRSDKQAIDDAVGVAVKGCEAPSAEERFTCGSAGQGMSGIHGEMSGSHAG